MRIKPFCRSLGILGLSVFCGAGIAVGAENSSSSQSSLQSPAITVVQLFSDVLIDVDDFEGWKVRGTGLGELSVWTRQGDENNRKNLLVQAQSDESQGKKIPLHPVTADPVKLTQETRELFEGIHDDTIRWDGSFAGYEYIFDPMMTLRTEGNPISIYLVREILHGGHGSERMATLAEISQDYIRKGAEFKSRGLTEVAQRFLKKGIRITQELAEAGNPEAQFVVGQAMEKGEGCPQDFVKSAEWYEKAARNRNSQAHEALKRRGFREFVQIWKNAHDEHFSHLAEAERALAKIYLHGNDWVPQDYLLASQWLKKHWSDSLKSAQEGDMQIQFGLGVMYADGFEVPRDEAQAKNWLKKAVEQGHRAAHDFLEDMGNPEKRINQRLAEFGIHVVALPGGTFEMGTSVGEAGRESWEETPHRVSLRPFFVMDTHIIRRQWMAVMDGKPALRGCYGIENWNESEMDLPANGITAHEVDTFVEKLKNKLNGSRLIPRLISSAEAEYLARLGVDKQIHAGPYPFPEGELGNYAVYDESQVQKVGSKRAIAGIYDARGNVYTWTSDLYDRGPDRVFRGGSFARPARHLRSGFRGYGDPSRCHASVGVRLVFH